MEEISTILHPLRGISLLLLAGQGLRISGNICRQNRPKHKERFAWFNQRTHLLIIILFLLIYLLASYLFRLVHFLNNIKNHIRLLFGEHAFNAVIMEFLKSGSIV